MSIGKAKSTYGPFGEGLARYKAFLKERLDKKYHREIDYFGGLRYYAIGTHRYDWLEGERYEILLSHQEIKNSESSGRFKEFVFLSKLTNEFLLIEKETTVQCFALINQQKNTYKDLNVGSLIAKFI